MPYFPPLQSGENDSLNTAAIKTNGVPGNLYAELLAQKRDFDESAYKKDLSVIEQASSITEFVKMCLDAWSDFIVAFKQNRLSINWIASENRLTYAGIFLLLVVILLKSVQQS
jgi:hypothetical protein